MTSVRRSRACGGMLQARGQQATGHRDTLSSPLAPVAAWGPAQAKPRLRASERHSAKIPARALVFQRSLGAKVEMAGA